MFELIKEITDHLKRGSTITSGTVFFLHNSFTCILVLGLSLITTAMEHYGSNIKCAPDMDKEVTADGKFEYDKYQEFFTTFCFINSTFTFDKGTASGFWEIGVRKYYSYYKWVGGALLLQAVLFYIPKVVWDSLEGGLMRKLAKDFKHDKEFKEYCEEKKESIIKMLLTHLERNKRYAINYWLCETLCLVNVVTQLFFVNHFFDGEFLSYGYNVMAFWFLGESYGFMNHIFPKVTRCTFYKEGGFKRHEFLCILPLNIVNEKTYLFFWFWFMILINLLVVLIIYRLFLLLRPSSRGRHLCFRNSLLPKGEALFISTCMDVSDWWILYMLNRNIDSVTFRDVMIEMVKTVKMKRRLIREENDGIELQLNNSTAEFFYPQSPI